jgi:hypothetical protein
MFDKSLAAVIESRHERLNFEAVFAHFVSAPATAMARAKSNHFPDHLVVALIMAGGPVGRGGRLAGIRRSIFLIFLVFPTIRCR